jgi:plastocyanin
MGDKSKTILVILVVAVLGVGVVFITKSTNKDHETTMHAPSTDTKDTKSANEIQETNAVTYQDFAVQPKSIRVKKGTTVKWTNKDTAKHDVTPEVETADFKASELFGKGESYEVTFNTVGTYSYHCSPHPYMKGSVEVVD